MNFSLKQINFLTKCCVVLLSILCGVCQPFFGQITHKKNSAVRTNIDVKAVTTGLESKEALARGLEFQELDSTYFMGYMYEGIYKVRHAQDEIGYKNAYEPLEKAYRLILEDYRKEITVRSTDVFELYYSFQLQMYAQEIVYNLWEAYMNAQDFQKAYDLSIEFSQLDLQLEFYFQSYTHLAWIFHKLRVSNSSQYSFLKDNVLDNVTMAQQYLDSAYKKAERDEALNSQIGYDFYNPSIYGIMHYQSVIFTYLLEMDSATYYYDLLKERGQYSHNNRGNFLQINGKFRQAEEEYTTAAARDNDPMNKSLKEFIYFTSFINVNKGIHLSYLEEMIATLKYENSKPGYGWYNLAMARTLLHSGQIAESKKYLNKAEKFKELHIGTTFGNEQYQMSLLALKYVQSAHELKAYKVRNSNWYWNPKRWLDVAALYFNKFVDRYNFISLLSAYPEREQVIYPLFTSESTIYWSEIVDILTELNPDFFIEYYYKMIMENDQRPGITPYYKIMLAQLYLYNQEYSQALTTVEDILDNPQIDEEYEQHLLGKAMALKSEILKALGNDDEAYVWAYKMFKTYPSLGGIEQNAVKFFIQNKSSFPSELFESFEQSQHKLVDNLGDDVIMLSMQYTENGGRHSAQLIASDAHADIIISEVSLQAKSIEELSELIYRATFGYVPLDSLNENSEQ